MPHPSRVAHTYRAPFKMNSNKYAWNGKLFRQFREQRAPETIIIILIVWWGEQERLEMASGKKEKLQ